MPNHFHFLIQIKPLSEELYYAARQEKTVKSGLFCEQNISLNEFLEDQFKRLFSSFALAINRQEENRTGSLLQKRFKRVLLRDEAKIWHTLAYIHHNPIHHNFCVNFGDWKYCSYQAFLSDAITSIERAQVLDWFAPEIEEAKERFITFHKSFKMERKEYYQFDLD